jgi:hypothetical protein
MRRSGRKPGWQSSCSLGVGCEESGVCYAAAHNDDERCGRRISKDDQRRRARTGWRNWYINRGRLPLQGDERIERQLSWRRVH